MRPGALHRRRTLVGDQPEPQFMQEVIKHLRLRRWDLIYHTYDSSKSVAGFPDIIALRDERGLALECKSQHGDAKPEQRGWIAGFARIPCFQARVVRPSDWPWIVEVAA